MLCIAVKAWLDQQAQARQISSPRKISCACVPALGRQRDLKRPTNMLGSSFRQNTLPHKILPGFSNVLQQASVVNH